MLEDLYRKANEIQLTTQSPRLREKQNKGSFCQISVGTFDPETTKYMFVSLNPGGDPDISTQSDPIQAALDHPSFKDYLSKTFRYAQNLKKVIQAFAEEKGITFEEAYPQFGTTDCSFFHSRTTSELLESFFIEVKESLPILLDQLSIVNLETIIFSGVPQSYFFYNLYKTGSPIRGNVCNQQVGKHDWLLSFKTTLINNREYNVCFMTHLTGTRGLKDIDLTSIGKQLAKGFIQQSDKVLDNSDVIL